MLAVTVDVLKEFVFIFLMFYLRTLNSKVVSEQMTLFLTINCDEPVVGTDSFTPLINN